MATKKKQPLGYYLGNLLMALSLVVVVYIYYPLLKLYLTPPNITDQLPPQGFYLTIPKISAQAPVVEKVDAFNQSEYLQALTQGVAQAKQSALPGENKTIYLFAHSSDSPLRITRYNTIFLRLGELNPGDQIKLTKDGKDYLYQVTDKKELWPKEVKYLEQDSGNRLILQTCTPVGTALKRLLVFANPI